MFLRTALTSGLLISSHAPLVFSSSLSSFALDVVRSLHRRADLFEDQLGRRAEGVIQELDQRQASSTASAPRVSVTPQTGDASQIDPLGWEEKTAAACSNAIAALSGQASNPSGMAVCYNLPFLDNSTGIFEAELRMYNVSPPIDPWTSITASDVNMVLQYQGATVQSTNGTFMKRGNSLSWPLPEEKSPNTLVWRQDAPPESLKVLRYVGQINNNLMGSAMNSDQLKPLLIPSIILSAKSPTNGKTINTTLSSTEASFVSGIFEEKATNATLSASSSPSVTPFQVPGLSLGIFPTGMIVTLIWTAGLFVTVGFGTIGRMQFRDQYRRRIKRDMAMDMRTI